MDQAVVGSTCASSVERIWPLERGPTVDASHHCQSTTPDMGSWKAKVYPLQILRKQRPLAPVTIDALVAHAIMQAKVGAVPKLDHIWHHSES